MTDPICDMLNRIRNSQAVSHQTVDIPFSKFKYEIAKLLVKNGFIEKAETKGRKPKKVIEIILKYKDKLPIISGLKRISVPGQRIYTNYREIKSVKSGYGIAIISTPKGLMTNKEARKKKVGGEILCEIW